MKRGVSRDTYVNADQKTNRGLTFDMLDSIQASLEEMKNAHIEHMKVCNGRFKVIEGRRKKDTAIASGSGVIGGFLAVASTWIKSFFT